jgi:hypothetical protein
VGADKGMNLKKRIKRGQDLEMKVFINNQGLIYQGVIVIKRIKK